MNELFYLLPGFLVYAFVCRLLNIDNKNDTFSIIFLSLFLSLIIYFPLSYLDSRNIISLNIFDWKLSLVLTGSIFLTSILVIIVIKYIFPKIEKQIQKFDIIKYNNKDVLTDILEKIKEDNPQTAREKAIWLTICTQDNNLYAGYIKNQGMFNDKHKAIYLKDVLRLNKKEGFNLNEFEGMLFLDNEIKWIAPIKYNYKK